MTVVRRWLGAAGMAVAIGAVCPQAVAQSGGVDRIERVPGAGFQPGAGARADGVMVMRPGALLFASFDRNFDGVVTPEEVDIGTAGAFAAADKNGDGVLSGFEQAEWAASVGSSNDILANPMTFDADFDRLITPTEFAAGIRRIADTLAGTPGGSIRVADLVEPLSRPPAAQAGRGAPSGGTLSRNGS